MKKYVTASLFIFWALTTAVIAAGLVSSGNNQKNISAVPGTNTLSISIPTNNNLTFNMAELAKHNSAESCWLLISGKIYDVTSFLNQHPGNADTILPSCGTDATAAYNTKGSKGRPHSSNANAMLADYYIGDLNQISKTGSAKTTSPKTATPIAPLREDEGEDD